MSTATIVSAKEQSFTTLRLSGASGSHKLHRWGLSPASRLSNAGIGPIFPIAAILSVTIFLNSLPVTTSFYTWLNNNYTPFQIDCWWTFGITAGVYWIGALVYLLPDLTGWPKTMKRWKIQPARKVTFGDYVKCSKVVLKNQLLGNLPVCYLGARFRAPPTGLPLPSAGTVIFTYIFALSCEEIGFYYVHRTLHHPALYKRFHKLHHEFTAPIAISAIYCSLVEHVCSNLFPILLGLFILRSHISLFWMFFCMLQLGVLATHSGYNMPFNYKSLQHDWHHYFFRENFGPTGVLDAVHGTNKVFKKWLLDLNREWGWESEDKAREIMAYWEEKVQIPKE